jgi:hypothetical protein
MLFAAFFTTVCTAAVDPGAGLMVVGAYSVLRAVRALWRIPTPHQRDRAAIEWHAAVDRLAQR